jgi:hypothetical protein
MAVYTFHEATFCAAPSRVVDRSGSAASKIYVADTGLEVG